MPKSNGENLAQRAIKANLTNLKCAKCGKVPAKRALKEIAKFKPEAHTHTPTLAHVHTHIHNQILRPPKQRKQTAKSQTC
ncbi:hypothetical protein M5D96_004384 [Drosophila gunungcola]|uniref:Uncharacterized protein n=1 Tax=Drosophila gunungcola TaxID=103775 RepID=A0A9P9YTW2_9MUSC|nr:hypothetical protein M5D96_004384 [Drosophila gunungcola]